MQIQIKPTSDIVKIGGIEARRWEGITDEGIRVHVFASLISVRNDQDQQAFIESMKELPSKAGSPQIVHAMEYADLIMAAANAAEQMQLAFDEQMRVTVDDRWPALDELRKALAPFLEAPA